MLDVDLIPDLLPVFDEVPQRSDLIVSSAFLSAVSMDAFTLFGFVEDQRFVVLQELAGRLNARLPNVKLPQVVERVREFHPHSGRLFQLRLSCDAIPAPPVDESMRSIVIELLLRLHRIRQVPSPQLLLRQSAAVWKNIRLHLDLFTRDLEVFDR